MHVARWSPLTVVLAAATLIAAALAVAGCGGGGRKDGDDRLNLTTPATPTTRGTPAPRPAPEPVSRREAAVIRGWARSLRHGHAIRASRYFAIPSVIVNGTPPVPIRTRKLAKLFNTSLSCGAKVVSLKRMEHHRVLATFRLTERPGGDCGPGVDNLAYTAFRIRRGRIAEWLRMDGPG
jgi:hypothetical protein